MQIYHCILHVHKLERVLNACIRFICNIRMNNHNLLPYYKECHILPIQYRIKYKLCLITFKIVNNLAPQYLTDTTYFHRLLRENLRIGNDRFILNSRHHIQNSISHKMCVSWNALPYVLRLKPVLQSLKKILKPPILKMCFAICVNNLLFNNFNN